MLLLYLGDSLGTLAGFLLKKEIMKKLFEKYVDKFSSYWFWIASIPVSVIPFQLINYENIRVISLIIGCVLLSIQIMALIIMIIYKKTW